MHGRVPLAAPVEKQPAARHSDRSCEALWTIVTFLMVFTRVITTGRSPRSTKRSGSIRNLLSPTSPAAKP